MRENGNQKDGRAAVNSATSQRNTKPAEEKDREGQWDASG